jgi:hypothetical protein
MEQNHKDWKVGDLVLCMNDSSLNKDPSLPFYGVECKAGLIYKIKAISYCPGCGNMNIDIGARNGNGIYETHCCVCDERTISKVGWCKAERFFKLTIN